MSYRPFVCVLGTFAFIAACGGGGEATPAPASPSGPSASAGRPPGAGAFQPGPGEWARWTHDDKRAWMQKTVSPKMHDLFVAVDTPRYGDMSCKTCHGEGAVEGSFAMPNPELPKLDPSPAAFEKLSKTNPKMFEFMAKQVEPTMASLIGEKPYDEKTKLGFNCFRCHTKT
jgi:hypothetical protein